jgi:hypothetical protein
MQDRYLDKKPAAMRAFCIVRQVCSVLLSGCASNDEFSGGSCLWRLKKFSLPKHAPKNFCVDADAALVCTALVRTNILKTVILAQTRTHGMQPCAIEVNEFGQV